MKPSRHRKVESELCALESELRQYLRAELPKGVKHAIDFFRDDRWTVRPELIRELREKAQKCVALRESLMLETDRTVGRLYLLAYEEANSDDPHRLGPVRMAERLLCQLNR